MTASTRSKLMFSVIIGLIALPAEALLLPVARTPNPSVAALEWAASLDPTELRHAAAHIDSYPGLYRKAIMGSLSPADRSDAWRAYFRGYAESHPALTADQRAVIQEAIDIASPEAFTAPVAPAVKERIGKIFTKAEKSLGKSVASELFVTLGPKVPVGQNALPLTQRLTDRLRSWGVVSAAARDEDPVYCNCSVDIDTCDVMPDPWLKCSELYSCEFDLDWPMCGPLWCWACTGWCKIIRFPAGGIGSN